MRIRFAAALAGAALVLSPAAALAQLRVGAEVEAIFPGDGLGTEDTGFGVAGRLGYALPGTPMLEITPEVRIGYIDFAEPTERDLSDISLVRYTAGLRLGVGEILRPTLFGHVGFGDLSLSDSDVAFFEERGGIDESAFTWDAGLALDLAILPLVDLGVHGAYNRLETDDAFDWWSAGVHASFGF